MRYKSRRDLFVTSVIYGAIAVMFAPLYPVITGQAAGTGAIIILLFFVAVSTLLLWILYGTKYTIDNEYITYSSGPIKGKIEISKIHTVISGKNLYIGFRPATAHKGIIVKYAKYDEIYFSPDSNDTFIEELLRINPEIKVKKNN